MLKINNIRVLDRKKKQLQQARVSQQTYIMMFTQTLKGCMKNALAEAIGDDVKHFDVDVEMFGKKVYITVNAVDDLGNWIYNGTAAHYVEAQNATALHFANGDFAASAYVPGIKAKKPKIDAALARGITQARAIMGGFRTG